MGVVEVPEVTLTGVSFRTLGIAEREILARDVTTPGRIARSLIDGGIAKEAAVLSTCNRFEIVTVGVSAEESLREFFRELIGVRFDRKVLYEFSGSDAVRHVYRVTSSLDSMVVGEQQILGQVKEAYRQAIDSGTVGTHLHHLFQSAFSIAKRVRTNTGVAQAGVSISYVAVKLAKQIFGDLEDRSVLVIGSGQMAELAVLHLCSHGCRRVTVVNRTLARAAELADRFGGAAIGLNELDPALATADICIGSLRIDQHVITPDRLTKIRRVDPLFLIDLGVPRNFHPDLGTMDSVYLYNVDDLSRVADQNKALRDEAMIEAEIVIEYGLRQFDLWRHKVSLQPDLVDFRERIRSVCEAEAHAVLGKAADPAAIRELAHRIGQKLAHDVTDLMVSVSVSDEE